METPDQQLKRLENDQAILFGFICRQGERRLIQTLHHIKKCCSFYTVKKQRMWQDCFCFVWFFFGQEFYSVPKKFCASVPFCLHKITQDHSSQSPCSGSFELCFPKLILIKDAKQFCIQLKFCFPGSQAARKDPILFCCALEPNMSQQFLFISTG